MTRLIYALVLWLFSMGYVHAEPVYPVQNATHIVDAANVIPANVKTELEAKLKALEAKTSAQVIVVTVPDLQGYAVEEFTIGLLRNWKLGAKDKNNGAVIFLAQKERKVRIEVGYGLEGALTDATSKVIISNGMIPRLRVNDYGGAFTRAVDDVGSIVSAEAGDQGWKGTKTDERQQGDATDIVKILVFLVFLVVFIKLQTRASRRSGFGSNIVILPGSLWGDGRGGGGFSGGGGFLGGGGTGGGGGASGDY